VLQCVLQLLAQQSMRELIKSTFSVYSVFKCVAAGRALCCSVLQCVCVCVCVHLEMCVCVYVYVGVHVFVCVYVSVCVSLCVSSKVHAFIRRKK